MPTSRRQYQTYRKDFRANRTEGTTKIASNRKDRTRDSARTFVQLFRSFVGLLRGQRRSLVIALATVTFAALMSLLQPFGLLIAYDYALDGKPLPAAFGRFAGSLSREGLLGAVAISMIVLAAVSTTIRMWGRWLATRAVKRVQSTVRRDVFAHAVRLPLHRVQAMKSGGAASILRDDIGSAAALIFSMLYNPWRAIVMLCGTLIVLTALDWRMLIASLVLFPLVFFTHRTWISRIRPRFRDIRSTRQSIDSHATESFGGMRVVRAFGRQRTETGRFTRGNHLMIRQEIDTWWLMRAIDIAWAILLPTATAALLWYGGLRVMHGEITTGALIAFLGYLAMLLEPMATLAASATEFQNGLAGLDRVLDLLEDPQEMPQRDDMVPLNPATVQGRITLENVSFAYPGSDRLVLRDVSIDVQPGEMIALVGPSGAGKTTFCNLVARFYDPAEGTICFDGVDLRRLDVEHYRTLLGVVEQDIFLFDGTIAANIGYGRRGATHDEIVDAARKANADSFIRDFEKGYETLIGERGVKLSGGQRQRLAIARAMLADPRILILDEATSNLDTESERLIQQSLHELMRDRTSFVIAHRLSTIMHADRILVIEDGEVVEQGTHDELMDQSGRYQRMVILQTSPPVEGMSNLAR
jgi:ATP-binding cassette subfamily B protein/subfamily B ATP-binding cassette protein MsbA